MRVAVVGAGALGSVYGSRLACLGGCEVDVVSNVRRPATATRVVRADSSSADVLEWATPASVPNLPASADVAIVCVRYEQLDAAIASANREASRAPLVVLTPMLPEDHARLSAAAPGRVVAAMAGAIAYRSDELTIRYWQPRSATTWIEAMPRPAAEGELARALERAGFRVKISPDVMARNVATTVSFMPLAMAVDTAGGIDALLGNGALLSLALRATDEGRALGSTVGKAEAWASTILAFARPFLLKAGMSLARARAPEALSYVEHHFVQKLHAQNVAMGAGIVALAKQRGMPCEALERLLAQLAAARRA